MDKVTEVVLNVFLKYLMRQTLVLKTKKLPIYINRLDYSRK